MAPCIACYPDPTQAVIPESPNGCPGSSATKLPTSASTAAPNTSLRHYMMCIIYIIFHYHPKDVFCSIYLSRNRCCFCFEACYPTHQRDLSQVDDLRSQSSGSTLLVDAWGPGRARLRLFGHCILGGSWATGFIWILLIAMVARIVAIILEYWYHWILELDLNYLKWGKMCLTHLLLWPGAKNISTHHADSVQGAGHWATNMILW